MRGTEEKKTGGKKIFSVVNTTVEGVMQTTWGKNSLTRAEKDVRGKYRGRARKDWKGITRLTI